MKFYINALNDRSLGSSYSTDIIGLFDSNEWKGSGNECGWYGSEYFLNTNLVAYFVQNNKDGQPYNPKTKYDEFYTINKFYEKASIGSMIWTKEIEANSKEEAIEIFKNQKW